MKISEAARAYAAQGWSLVEFPADRKGPQHPDWNHPQNVTRDPEEAEHFTQNMGLCHALSGTCALDLDDLQLALPYLTAAGLDGQALLDASDAVRISSGRPNRAKLLYRIPDGVDPLSLISQRPRESGLELRCAARTGYTVQDVLPPSIHPVTQKPYTWEYGDDLAGHWSVLPPLPEGLLALWRSLAATPLPSTNAAPKGLAADRLRGMLSRLDPDCDYHEWTKVCAALHHETEGAEWGLDLWDEWSAGGSKYKSRADLAGHWNSFGNYKGRPVTVQSLISMSGGVSADDFDDLTQLPEPIKRPKFEVVPVGSFSEGPSPQWIIKGVLPAAGLGCVYGESGSGKSFEVFDMCAAIARGEPWNGKRVRQGRVVYVAAEGAGGMRNRARAYGQHFGVDLAALPFGVVADRPNFLKEDHKLLANQINASGGADVVVLDTLAQVTAGGDENSGEDMGKVLVRCQELHAMTGAMVVLVHHSGKDATRGARGWSGIKAAMDCELEITREGDDRVLRVSKQKDGEDGGQFAFRLNTVELGQDSDGDPITSCVVQWVEMAATKPRGIPKGRWQLVVWDTVQDNLDLCDGAVPIALVLDRAMQVVPADPNGVDRRREMARRAFENLVMDGWLVVQGKTVSVKPNKEG